MSAEALAVEAPDRTKRYHYEPGTVRWLLLQDGANPKGHRTTKGWRVTVHELDHHPVTCNRLQNPQTWVKETYIGD